MDFCLFCEYRKHDVVWLLVTFRTSLSCKLHQLLSLGKHLYRTLRHLLLQSLLHMTHQTPLFMQTLFLLEEFLNCNSLVFLQSLCRLLQLVVDNRPNIVVNFQERHLLELDFGLNLQYCFHSLRDRLFETLAEFGKQLTGCIS